MSQAKWKKKGQVAARTAWRSVIFSFSSIEGGGWGGFAEKSLCLTGKTGQSRVRYPRSSGLESLRRDRGA
jgi:hypothetical protein